MWRVVAKPKLFVFQEDRSGVLRRAIVCMCRFPDLHRLDKAGNEYPITWRDLNRHERLTAVDSRLAMSKGDGTRDALDGAKPPKLPTCRATGKGTVPTLRTICAWLRVCSGSLIQACRIRELDVSANMGTGMSCCVECVGVPDRTLLPLEESLQSLSEEELSRALLGCSVWVRVLSQ